MNSAAPFHVRCPCGQDLPVATSAAGREVTCHCGQSIKVPRLSELRRLAGQPAFEVPARDRIRQLLLDGGLPPDPICRISQRPTSDVIHITVVCDVPRPSGGFSWSWQVILMVAAFFVSCWLLPLYLIISRDQPQVLGSETVFRLPVPVAADRQAQVRDYSEIELFRLLWTVPLYAQLLTEYPQARVSL
jgi:hypothetical protein